MVPNDEGDRLNDMMTTMVAITRVPDDEGDRLDDYDGDITRVLE